ncbi:hypothetical protein AAG906_016803 [Vitis piasezkii]
MDRGFRTLSVVCEIVPQLDAADFEVHIFLISAPNHTWFCFKLTKKKVMEITYEEKHSLECFPLMDFSTNSLSLMQLAMARASHLAFSIQVTSQKLARDKLVHLHGRRSLALPSVGSSELKVF